MTAGQSTFGSYNIISGFLPGYVTTGGTNNNALVYAFTFNPSTLVSLPVNNFQYVQQLYDYIKVFKVQCNFKSTVDPRVALQLAAQTSLPYNLGAWPGADPVITWIDYDGYEAMPKVGNTGVVSVPTNGDFTQLVNNKAGAKKHHPYRNIRRTFYPKQINLIAGDSSSGPSGSPSTVQGKRLGWLCQQSSNCYTGNLMMAVPYLGQDFATQLNMQPTLNWAIVCRWFMGFKCPLYG